jgi:hypothetical protein
LHTNPSEPLMAPAQPRSHGASARHFLEHPVVKQHAVPTVVIR